jgi:hypothetical protein
VIPIVFHFDGQEFKPVPFPLKQAAFAGIAQIASNDAWIVGRGGPNPTLTAHWDGKVWTVVPSPGAGTGTSSQLTGVSAISSTDVWASGIVQLLGNSGGFLNLVEHWDGKSWTVSPIPSSQAQFDVLKAALAFPSGNVFMAGSRLHCVNHFCAGFDSVVFHTKQGN